MVPGQELSSNAGLANDLPGKPEKATSPLGAFICVCFAHSTSERGLLLPVQAYRLLRSWHGRQLLLLTANANSK